MKASVHLLRALRFNFHYRQMLVAQRGFGKRPMTQAPLTARVLLIIGGEIAAYKSLELIRRLRDRGAEVRVVMTKAALEFDPLSAATLSGASVRSDLFSLTDEASLEEGSAARTLR